MQKKTVMPESAREFFVEMGRIGGKKGGGARAASLTPERRKEIAQKAIATRWEKKKKS